MFIKQYFQWLRVCLNRLALYSSLLLAVGGLSHSQAHAQESFLDLVPAETPYFLDYKMVDQAIQMMPKTLPDMKMDLTLIDSASEKLMILFMQDFMKHYNQKTLAQLGLKDIQDFHIGIYGLGIWPVLTLAVEKQGLFTRWFVKTSKKAGLKLSQEGRSLKLSLAPEASLILSFVGKSWVTIALVPTELQKEMLPYLNGTKKPVNSIQDSGQITRWAKEISSAKEILMAVNVERIIKTLLGRGEGLNKSFAMVGDLISKAVPKSCVDDYLEFSKAIPYILGGFKMSSKGFGGVSLFKFSPELAKVTQGFLAESSYELKADGHLINLSLALNLKAIVAGMQQFMQAKIEKPFTCPNLLRSFNPQKLQMLLSQVMMVPPFAYDLIGVSVVVKEINPSPQAQVVINAKNVSNLLNIAKSFNPQFAQVKLPAVGAPPALLEGLPIPPNFKVMVQVYKNALGLSLGVGQSEDLQKTLKGKANLNPSLFKLSYNLGRFFKMFSNMIESTKKFKRKSQEAKYKMELEQAKLNGTKAPTPPKFDDDLDPIDMLQKSMSGMVSFKFNFDSRGFVVNSIMQPSAQP